MIEPAVWNWSENLLQRGKDWQKQRDYATLSYLTAQLIDRVPYVSVPMLKIIEVLGQPDSQVGGSSTYFATHEGKQNGYLYLELNSEGNVTGWKLDNIS